MKYLVTIFFFLSPAISHAQTVSRIIADRSTNLPVAYATIKVLHSSKGEIANEKGEFFLLLEPSDTILITSVGYHSRKIPSSQVTQLIFLDPKPGTLVPVVVRETVLLRTIFLGNGKEYINEALPCRFNAKGSLDGCWPWGPSDKKEEFAEKIVFPDPAKLYFLKKLIIPTRKTNNYGPLLVRIYAEDSATGLPGEELFQKRIEVRNRDVIKHKVHVDLGPEQLSFSETSAIFISVGWPPGARIPGSTTLAFYETTNDNFFSRNLVSTEYIWFPFGRIISSQGQPRRIGSFYCIEVEERVFK